MDAIKGILKDVLEDLSRKQRDTDLDRTQKAWKRIVGAKAYPHTKIVYLTKEKIRVNVDNSAWLFELNGQKTRIVRDLEKALKISDVRFSLGDV